MTAVHSTADTGLLSGLKRIYAHAGRPRRRQFHIVVALMVAGAFAEISTIGAVIPFLALLAGAGSEVPVIGGLLDELPATGHGRLLAAGGLFAALAVASGAVRLQLARSTQDFAYRLAHEMMVEAERRILLQPYSFHVQRNSSSLLAGLEKTELLVFEMVLPLMQGAIAAFLAVFIMFALVWVDPITTGLTAAVFGVLYLLVASVARRQLARNSEVVGRGFNDRLKIAQESLGGIRDIIVDDSHSYYLDQFRRVNLNLSLARSATSFVATAPRFIMETAGMIGVTAIAIAVSYREPGLTSAIPALGAIALGAQRLLPLLQQIYTAWSTTSGNRALLNQTLELIYLPVDDARTSAAAPLPFEDRISVEGLSFTFSERQRPALEDINLHIRKGSAVAIAGETGSGKSTLADLLMGLLEPDLGCIRIDGTLLVQKNQRRWQRSIAHVPQTIFLADTTIARNVALSVRAEDPDQERVVEAVEMANLGEFVRSLPDGYETVVGERGIRLSGGQRQRLGIARAIYKQTPVLILDEATSALDDATEQAVFDGLEQLRSQGKTLIIIAHRKSTIERCTGVVRLHHGKVVDTNRPPA